jgi:hypothetical protein
MNSLKTAVTNENVDHQGISKRYVVVTGDRRYP